jgi:hypothetical protein
MSLMLLIIIVLFILMILSIFVGLVIRQARDRSNDSFMQSGFPQSGAPGKAEHAGAFCAHCGTRNAVDSQFCRGCGQGTKKAPMQ